MEEGEAPPLLLCTKNAISSISKSWADIGIGIELSVKMTNIDLDIRMCLF